MSLLTSCIYRDCNLNVIFIPLFFVGICASLPNPLFFPIHFYGIFFIFTYNYPKITNNKQLKSCIIENFMYVSMYDELIIF